jgi:hypothetical protein
VVEAASSSVIVILQNAQNLSFDSVGDRQRFVTTIRQRRNAPIREKPKN